MLFFFHRVIYLWTKSSLLSRLQRSTTKVEVVLRNNFASIFIRIACVTGFCFSAVKETSTKLFSSSTFLTWLVAHFLRRILYCALTKLLIFTQKYHLLLHANVCGLVIAFDRAMNQSRIFAVWV